MGTLVECQVCGRTDVRLTKAGVVAKHGACVGGGQKPLPAMDFLEARYAAALAEYEVVPNALYSPVVEWGTRLFNAKCRAVAGSERRVYEAEMRFVVEVVKTLGQLLWLRTAWLDYGHCHECGAEVSQDRYANAYRRVEKPTCSLECARAAYVKRFACCGKAEVLPCVCAHSFRCPIHGDTHAGTHD